MSNLTSNSNSSDMMINSNNGIAYYNDMKIQIICIKNYYDKDTLKLGIVLNRTYIFIKLNDNIIDITNEDIDYFHKLFEIFRNTKYLKKIYNISMFAR